MKKKQQEESTKKIGVQTSESLKRRENLPETAGLHREGPQRSIWSWMPSRPDQSW